MVLLESFSILKLFWLERGVQKMHHRLVLGVLSNLYPYELQNHAKYIFHTRGICVREVFQHQSAGACDRDEKKTLQKKPVMVGGTCTQLSAPVQNCCDTIQPFQINWKKGDFIAFFTPIVRLVRTQMMQRARPEQSATAARLGSEPCLCVPVLNEKCKRWCWNPRWQVVHCTLNNSRFRRTCFSTGEARSRKAKNET